MERVVSVRKFSRRSLVIAGIVFLVLLVAGTVALRSRGRAPIAQVPFSDLLRHLDDGAVREVAINADTLEFKLKSGQAFRTVTAGLTLSELAA